jgi:hypothetical protein
MLDQSNLSTQRCRLIFWVECSVGGYLALAKTIVMFDSVSEPNQTAISIKKKVRSPKKCALELGIYQTKNKRPAFFCIYGIPIAVTTSTFPLGRQLWATRIYRLSQLRLSSLISRLFANGFL